MGKSSDKEPQEVSATDNSSEDTRRAALAKVALYAAYTTPVMLGMMTSAKAQVASGGIISPND